MQPLPSRAGAVTLGATLAALASLSCASRAQANPRPLPFTYQTETLPEGAVEIEQYGDFTPVRAISGLGVETWHGATAFQTAIEYGITDRLELALYFTFVPTPRSEDAQRTPRLPVGNGLRQRLRYRLSDPGEWPLDVGLYGEVTENERELELEAKIILQRRLGPLRAIANLSAEREFYWNGTKDWILNPSAGLTWEISPRFHPGLEAWMRAEYPDSKPASRPFELGPHVYAGPTFLVSFGRLWWTTGVYVRTTNWKHRLQTEESHGKVWARTLVGLGF